MKLWATCQINYVIFFLLLFPFYFLRNEHWFTKQYKSQKATFQRYFFSSLAFPPFYHHVHHHYLCTFPLNKNENTKHCHSNNTWPWPSLPQLDPWESQAVQNPPPPYTTTNQNDQSLWESSWAFKTTTKGVMRGPAVPGVKNTPEGTLLSYTICCQYISKVQSTYKVNFIQRKRNILTPAVLLWSDNFPV